MTHKIPEDTLNSNIEYCINEYVRVREHQDILRERWFEELTLKEISDKHHICVDSVKKIVYGTGDKILSRASKLKNIQNTTKDRLF